MTARTKCPQCNQAHGPTLGIRAYARHRGVSQAAVQKAVREDRIAVLPGKKIDVAAADRAWSENSSPLPAHNAKTVKRDEKPDSNAASFAAARARKETAIADFRETQALKARGRLLDIDDVAADLAACLEATAKPIRALPPRLLRELVNAGLLLPGVDARARAIIEKEVDALLEELQRAADKLPTDVDNAPGGGGDLAA